jgi:uncharacterized damage-inducible protein DinB
VSELIKLQFQLSRESLLKDLEGLSSEKCKIQPEGFNNTIQWHLGHIVSTAEKFLFHKNSDLPANYGELFGFGSKPSAWGTEVPTVEALVDQLKNQLERIKNIPDDRFQEKLPTVILGRTTYGELAALGAVHESNHVGQIHAMKRLID